MKLLIDNCFPRDTARKILHPHDVIHASESGYATLTNGRLLQQAADDGYDALVTIDKKMLYEQNAEKLPVPLVIVGGPSTRVPDLLAMADHIQRAVEETARWMLISVDHQGEFTRRGRRHP